MHLHPKYRTCSRVHLPTAPAVVVKQLLLSSHYTNCFHKKGQATMYEKVCHYCVLWYKVLTKRLERKINVNADKTIGEFQ